MKDQPQLARLIVPLSLDDLDLATQMRCSGNQYSTHLGRDLDRKTFLPDY